MNSQSLTFPPNTSVQDREIINAVSRYTMTSVERQIALIEATRYIIDSKIDGCFVECGVWRGGSCMAIAITLLKEDELNRNLYLYDTFLFFSCYPFDLIYNQQKVLKIHTKAPSIGYLFQPNNHLLL